MPNLVASDLCYYGCMGNAKVTQAGRLAALIGNVIFIVWILFNGLDSDWKGTPVEMASAGMLILLLILNSFLLLAARRNRRGV